MICIYYIHMYCYISYLEIKSLFHQMDGWGRFIFPSSFICISIWWLDCFVHLLTCLKKIIHLSSRLYLDLCIIPSNGFTARASAVHLIWTKSFSAKIQDDSNKQKIYTKTKTKLKRTKDKHKDKDKTWTNKRNHKYKDKTDGRSLTEKIPANTFFLSTSRVLNHFYTKKGFQRK